MITEIETGASHVFLNDLAAQIIELVLESEEADVEFGNGDIIKFKG